MSRNKLRVVPINLATPGNARLLMHEATIYGIAHGVDGVTVGDMLVVGRRRPFIPCGDDPAPVNRECARRYAVDIAPTGEPCVYELDAEAIARVEPFVDVEQMLREADERANAAQRTNRKPISELIAKSSIGEALRDVEERGIDAHLDDPETKP